MAVPVADETQPRLMMLRWLVGRFQWFVPIAMIPWWLMAPGSGTGGYAFAFAMVFAPLMALCAYVPSVVEKLVRRGRARVSVPYAVVMVAYWVMLLLIPMGVEGGDDMRDYPSVFESMGVPTGAGYAVSVGALAAGFILWIAAVVIASTSGHGAATDARTAPAGPDTAPGATGAGVAAPPRRNGIATAAMILGVVTGILSVLAPVLTHTTSLPMVWLVVVGRVRLIPAILAVVFGIIGLRRANRLGGRALALVGLILGGVILLADVVGITVAMVSALGAAA